MNRVKPEDIKVGQVWTNRWFTMGRCTRSPAVLFIAEECKSGSSSRHILRGKGPHFLTLGTRPPSERGLFFRRDEFTQRVMTLEDLVLFLSRHYERNSLQFLVKHTSPEKIVRDKIKKKRQECQHTFNKLRQHMDQLNNWEEGIC